MNNISVSFDNREPLLENITPQGCNKAIKLKDLKAGDNLVSTSLQNRKYILQIMSV